MIKHPELFSMVSVPFFLMWNFYFKKCIHINCTCPPDYNSYMCLWDLHVKDECFIKYFTLRAPQAFIKGNMHTISPGRNRVNFQILAYLLTIDLLYGTGCLSYWFCYYMLRLDSSEMLPGSQKGEEMTAILKPHARLRHFYSTQVRAMRWIMGYLWFLRVMITWHREM